MSIVVTGIHTGSGKTVVSALLAAALDAYYWKPVQSGLEEETDTQAVARMAALPPEKLIPEGYRLQWPASPHASAEAEGVVIDPKKLTVPQVDSNLILEGAGGLMVPLNRQYLFADLFQDWQLPVVLVADTYLGSINHSLLSAELLKSRGIPVLGIVFNDRGRPESEDVIAEFSGFPVLGRVPPLDHINRESLLKVFRDHFDPGPFGLKTV